MNCAWTTNADGASRPNTPARLPVVAETTGKKVCLADRLGLRPKEVATALGLSERAVRQMLPTLPHIRFGSAVVVPIDSLREWLRKQAQMEHNAVGKAVDEVLEKIRSDR